MSNSKLKMKKLNSPKIILTLYFLLIFLYSIVYFFIPNDTFEREIVCYIDSVYFSVVTITTLGYGDIYPITSSGKLLVASEAILGVVFIGWFLNSLAHKVSTIQSESLKQSREEEYRKTNLDQMSTQWLYLEPLINDHIHSIIDISQDFQSRQIIHDSGDYGNISIEFQNMINILSLSIRTTHLFGPSFDLYRESYTRTREEIKYFLSNIDMTEYSQLKQIMLDYLIETALDNNNETLKNIVAVEHRDLMNNNPNNGLNDFSGTDLYESICNVDGEPELENYRSNTLTPIVILYLNIKFQLQQFQLIKNEINRIIKIEHGT